MDMKGKTVLVTGATNGIGKATALGLAAMGAKVVIAGRSDQKAKAVLGEIFAATKNENLSYLTGDLSSQAEVRRLAQEFLSLHDRLDVLVNNAGAVFDSRKLTVDGFEQTFAVNHLSYFLLTYLLLERIKQTGQGRIVNVASDAQTGAKIDFENLQAQKRFTGFGAYGQSKLANVMFSNELAKRLEGIGITSNALHPGVVSTGFGDNATSPLWKAGLWLFKRFTVSPEKGAETSIYLASSDEVAGVTGKYFDKKKSKPSNPISYDQAECERLWNVSLKLCGLE